MVWTIDLLMARVMIKDAKGRYPGNPLWGDQPARATDWVYVKSYPVLTRE